MSDENTVAIQVTSDDPKKPKDKPEQDGKPKPDGKEQDGEDLVCMPDLGCVWACMLT